MLFNSKPEEYNEPKSFHARSIGRVVGDWNGYKQIKRIADIESGVIRRFYQDSTTPPHYLKNREEFYCEKIPHDRKILGVWDWKARPHGRIDGKDVNFYTHFLGTDLIKEVVIFRQCKNIEEVVSQLTRGFEKELNCENILFTYKPNNVRKPVEGALCRRKDFDFSGTKASLKKTVKDLPIFKISPLNMSAIENFILYNKIDIGVSEYLFHITRPSETIKNPIYAGITSKKANQQLGFTGIDAAGIKTIVKNLRLPLERELCAVYQCTNNDANQYIENFLKNAEIYLSEQDVDIELISKALEMNPELKKRYKEELTNKWKSENIEIISTEEKKILQLYQEEELLKQHNQELIKTRDNLKKEIDGRKKFIASIESNIKQIKSEKTEFISKEEDKILQLLQEEERLKQQNQKLIKERDDLKKEIENSEQIIAGIEFNIKQKIQSENTEIISAEENKIVQLQQEGERLKQQNQALIEERDTLKKDIEGGKQFIADFDSNVKQKIQEAKDNVAEFVSQMTFISAATAPVSPYHGSNFATGTKIITSAFDFEPSSSKIDNVSEFEDILAENLQQVGYDEDTAIETAQTATFCLCNNIPLIVGENAVAITRCLAATMGETRLYEMFLTGQDTNPYDLSIESDIAPAVCLIHGVLDGYDVRLFNLLSNQLRNGYLQSFIVISLEGVPVRMLPPGIWNHAFYVDGDAGLKSDFSNHTLSICEPTIEFTLPKDDQAFSKLQKEKKKQLKPFFDVITNILICRYARYLADFGKDLNDSTTILTQMIAIARSSGIETEEKLASLFREHKIGIGITMLEEFRG